MRERCLKTVYELAKRDERIVFIGSDLGVGVLDDVQANIPRPLLHGGRQRSRTSSASPRAWRWKGTSCT